MIDVIIPVYNAHKTIERTLLSINFQTIKDEINIYIIDDASDETYDDIIKTFLDKLNIKVIRLNENKGPGYARNIGIENSTNPYILFIDADDELYNSFTLEHLKKYIEEYDMCYGGIYQDEGNKEYTYYDSHNGCLHGKLYKRSIINKYNISFNDYRYSEDNYFNQLYVALASNIYYINEPSYVYNNSVNSLTKDNEEKVNYYYNKSMNLLINKCEFLNVEIYKIKNILLSCLCYNYEQYVLSDCKNKYYLTQPQEELKDFYIKYKDYIFDYEVKNILRECDINILEKITFREYLKDLIKD